MVSEFGMMVIPVGGSKQESVWKYLWGIYLFLALSSGCIDVFRLWTFSEFYTYDRYASLYVYCTSIKKTKQTQ